MECAIIFADSSFVKWSMAFSAYTVATISLRIEIDIVSSYNNALAPKIFNYIYES